MSRYRERVWPSAWVFLVGLIAVPSIMLVFAPFNLAVGTIAGCAVYLGIVAILVSSSPVIEVTDDQLRVGSARIPLRYTGAVTANETRDAARLAAGPRLDSRAWLCLRGWVSTSVRVDVTDDNDPVPYWLFSSRHPVQVRAAINAARSAAGQKEAR